MKADGYFQGDAYQLTGEPPYQKHGGQFQSARLMEGHREGEIIELATKKQRDQNAERARQEWEQQQAGFRRLREAQGAENTKNAKGKDMNTRAAIKILVDQQKTDVSTAAENAAETKRGPGICVECCHVYPSVPAGEVEDCRDCGSAGTVRGILMLMGVV